MDRGLLKEIEESTEIRTRGVVKKKGSSLIGDKL